MLYCDGVQCVPQRTGNVEHRVGRGELNIDDGSPLTVEK